MCHTHAPGVRSTDGIFSIIIGREYIVEQAIEARRARPRGPRLLESHALKVASGSDPGRSIVCESSLTSSDCSCGTLPGTTPKLTSRARVALSARSPGRHGAGAPTHGCGEELRCCERSQAPLHVSRLRTSLPIVAVPAAK